MVSNDHLDKAIKNKGKKPNCSKKVCHYFISCYAIHYVGQYGSLHGFISILELQLSFSLLHLFILLWRKWALFSFLHNLIPTTGCLQNFHRIVV